MKEEHAWKYRLFRVLQVLICAIAAAYIFIDYPRDEGHINDTYVIVNPEKYSVSDRLLGENAYNLEVINCFNKEGRGRYVSPEIKASCESKLTLFQDKYLEAVLKNGAEHNDPQKVRQALITASNLDAECVGVPKPQVQVKDGSTRAWREFQGGLQLCQWHKDLSIDDQKELADINSVTAEHHRQFVEGSSNLPIIIMSSLLGFAACCLVTESLYRLVLYIRHGRIRDIP